MGENDASSDLSDEHMQRFHIGSSEHRNEIWRGTNYQMGLCGDKEICTLTGQTNQLS
jgi:hypothetical protein